MPRFGLNLKSTNSPRVINMIFKLNIRASKIQQFKLRGLLLTVLILCQSCGGAATSEPSAIALAQMPSESPSTAVKAEVVGSAGSYQLLRGGEPYHVKGAGIAYGDYEAFARHGGNSFRTWSTDSHGRTGLEVLDIAHSLGLTVAMTIVMGVEHWGFDYDDEAAVAAQFEFAKQEVLALKDHPALLAWVIGNELNYDYQNPKVYDAVNEVSKMIHELDPNHPTSTTLAGYSTEVMEVVQTRASDLDFVSIQAYGSLVLLPEWLARDNFTKPYFITEWGAVGHWEVAQTSWGAPIEQTSTEKAANYLRSYNEVIRPFPEQVLGSYVFLWGQKQERTGTWYGLFTTNGEETEPVDVMHYIWNGEWPENRTPAIDSMTLNGKTSHDNVTLSSNQIYGAKLVAVDPDSDALSYHWELRQESTSTESGGAQEEIPTVIEGLIENTVDSEILLRTPSEEGPYRLFVYAYDGNDHAAHANIPFYVND